MRHGVCSSWHGLCLLNGFAWGQVVVEAPHMKQAMAGIRSYFGYACETAGHPPSTITVGFNGGSPTRIASGLDRADTTGVCNNDGFNGFVGFTNFKLFPLGANTFELYRDGVSVATIPFENAPWSDGTEFIPGPDPTIPAPPEGTFDSTAPATEAYVFPKIDTLNTGQSLDFSALRRNAAASHNPGSVLIYPFDRLTVRRNPT